MVFKKLCVLVIWLKVALALEGLSAEFSSTPPLPHHKKKHRIGYINFPALAEMNLKETYSLIIPAVVGRT